MKLTSTLPMHKMATICLAVCSLPFAGVALTAVESGSAVDGRPLIGGWARPTRSAPLRSHRAEWIDASVDQRKGIAERIGEEGVEVYARQQGWRPLLLPWQKSLRQGIDQVYIGPDGVVYAIEAKGGTSPANRAYGGYLQGTPEYAVRAAKATLDSPKASALEKAANAEVLRAAAEGRLRTGLLRTRHVLGEPRTPIMESLYTVRTGDRAAVMASSYLSRTAATPKTGSRVPPANNGLGGTLKSVGTAGLVTLGLSGMVNGYYAYTGRVTVKQGVFNTVTDATLASGGVAIGKTFVETVGGRLVLGVPAKVGGTFTVATFVFDAGKAGIRFADGQIGRRELGWELAKAGGKSVLVGAGTGLFVAMAGGPAGVTVYIVGVGLYIAADFVVEGIADHYGSKPLTVEDFAGLIPSGVNTQPGLADILSGEIPTSRRGQPGLKDILGGR